MTYILRQQQVEVLEFVKAAVKRGVRMIAVEAPTGSGKSIIAHELTKIFGASYVLIPYVSLQNQYCQEFEDAAPLLGRGRFPCYNADIETARACISIVKEGLVPPRPEPEMSCAFGPCLKKPKKKADSVRQQCEDLGGCPHQHSINAAEEYNLVAANYYSYIYNVYLGSKLQHRKVMILDEAHLAAGTIRGFLSTKFLVRRVVDDVEIRHLKTTEQWVQWLSLPKQLELLRTEAERDSYQQRLEKLSNIGASVFKTWRDENERLWVEFIPVHVGSAFQKMILSYADIVVFMSGSILNLKLFSQQLGLDQDNMAFLRLPSTFPKDNRKVFLPNRQDIDLSFKNKDADIPRAVAEVKRIMAKYPNVKGIVQVASYRLGKALIEGLKSPRVVTHESQDFAKVLDNFKQSDLPLVLVSPNIVEGVDFKEDYARFQIILSPQYEPASEPYTKYLLDNGRWDLYRYEAAKTLVQQLGRGVRSPTDSCDNYLIDNRFFKFVKDTWNYYPQWLQESFVKES